MQVSHRSQLEIQKAKKAYELNDFAVYLQEVEQRVKAYRLRNRKVK